MSRRQKYYLSENERLTLLKKQINKMNESEKINYFLDLKREVDRAWYLDSIEKYYNLSEQLKEVKKHLKNFDKAYDNLYQQEQEKRLTNWNYI